MNNYEMMKISEQCDDDAYEYYDFDTEQLDSSSDAEKFKRKYKEFYTDIKLSDKEDW